MLASIKTLPELSLLVIRHGLSGLLCVRIEFISLPSGFSIWKRGSGSCGSGDWFLGLVLAARLTASARIGLDRRSLRVGRDGHGHGSGGRQSGRAGWRFALDLLGLGRCGQHREHGPVRDGRLVLHDRSRLRGAVRTARGRRAEVNSSFFFLKITLLHCKSRGCAKFRLRIFEHLNSVLPFPDRGHGIIDKPIRE